MLCLKARLSRVLAEQVKSYVINGSSVCPKLEFEEGACEIGLWVCRAFFITLQLFSGFKPESLVDSLAIQEHELAFASLAEPVLIQYLVLTFKTLW